MRLEYDRQAYMAKADINIGDIWFHNVITF